MATVYTHKVPAASAGLPLPSRLDRKREKPLREKICGEDISAPQHFGVNFKYGVFNMRPFPRSYNVL